MPLRIRYCIQHRVSMILILVLISFASVAEPATESDPGKQTIKALYIPLADHYAALVAYERYGSQMKYADFQIEEMKNWYLLRAYFQSGEVDMAFVMSPLAMDMFSEKPHFRWIGLMHRDGNALAINDVLNREVELSPLRQDRKPDAQVADALKKLYQQSGVPIEVGVPHYLATHTVILYRYLKEQGLRFSLNSRFNNDAEAVVLAIAPSKSPSYINSKTNRDKAAAVEQSLPWAEIVESEGFGQVAWYSKDVMPWPNGHVECVALATDIAIANKPEALKEVMSYIRQAGRDIEQARLEGGEQLDRIIEIVRKHIPAHSREAIITSLDPHLRVINYLHLNVDMEGMRQIMDLAVESGILKHPVDLDEFVDTRFDGASNE